jgi:hypothetical protein
MRLTSACFTVFLSFSAIAVHNAAGAERLAVVDAPPASGRSTLYPSNREPLTPSPLIKLPVGSIAPGGWLRHQLELEAKGMEGHLEEISPWCKFEGNAWTDPKGQGRNGWEEVPYWLKGYGDLGYVLKDQRIIDDAKRWLDAIFAAQADDGWFGPVGLKTSLKGKPDLWPHMPVLNALQSYYEFCGDPRVLKLMTGYFKWELACPDADFITGYWDHMRTGDNMESVYWLYNRTGDKWLLDLADKIHRHAADWVSGMPNWHNVNVAEGFREPAEFGMQAGDAKFYAATVHDYDTVMGQYGQVPGGGFGGDENCRPGHYGPGQGFETCGIVEFMHSFEMLTRISAAPVWADRCEEIAFNSLPAALTPDLKALHYLTAPNQIELDKNNKAPSINNSGTMFSYSPNGVYRCCQHNHGMGWPYYAEELWLATSDDGLCASLYSASEVNAKVADGSLVKVVETTDYPFSDTVELKLSTAKPVRFPLYLRVPRWCNRPTLAINGKDEPVDARPPSYIVIDRTWADGDAVTLKLPMHVSLRFWEKNQGSVSVDYGPLTFSLDIGQKWVKYGGSEQWPEQEVYPTTPWNYGLVLKDKDPASSFEVVRKPGPLAEQPFTPESSQIELKATARKIPNWTADRNELIRPLQASPVASDEPAETVTLIPMGAARLRITAFPVIGQGPGANEWKAAPAKPIVTGPAAKAKTSASHVFENDTLAALNDGILPESSGDTDIPRFTWWDHKGSAEWAQYDFETPQKVSGVSVYWFDDTGKGQCRKPQSWRLLYRDGNEWKPVSAGAAASEYGTKLDTLNRVTFTPVQTTGLRIEVQLKEHFSGGILEWKVE